MLTPQQEYHNILDEINVLSTKGTLTDEEKERLRQLNFQESVAFANYYGKCKFDMRLTK